MWHFIFIFNFVLIPDWVAQSCVHFLQSKQVACVFCDFLFVLFCFKLCVYLYCHSGQARLAGILRLAPGRWGRLDRTESKEEEIKVASHCYVASGGKN